MGADRSPVSGNAALALEPRGGVPAHRNCASRRVCNLRGQRFERVFSALFVIIVRFGTMLDRIPYSTRGHDGHESHSLLLVIA